MNVRRLVGPLLALAVGGIAYALWPQQKRTPEDEIRSTLTAAMAAAEARNPSQLIDFFHEKFRGPQGIDHEQLCALLVGQLLRSNKLVVLNPTLQVSVLALDRAQFRGTFLFAREAVGPDASKYEIEGELEKVGPNWKFVSARWHQ